MLVFILASMGHQAKVGPHLKVKKVDLIDHRKVVRLVYLVAFVDLLSASMTSTLLSTYLKDVLLLSSSVSGVIGSLYGVVQCFSSPVVGGLADINGYRSALLWTIALCVPAYALLCIHFVPVIILSRALAGSFKHTQNLSRTFVAAFATDEEKVQAFGTLNAVGNLGFIFGPALAGIITATCGFHCIFVATAVCFALNYAIVYVYFPTLDNIQSPTHFNDNDTNNNCSRNGTTSNQNSFMQLVRHVDWTSQWDLVAVRFLLSLSVLIYRAGFNWYLTQIFSVQPQTIAYLTSYQGVVAFLSSYYTSTLVSYCNSDCVYVLLLAIYMGCISLVGFLLSPSIMVYSALLLPYCISNSLLRVVTLQLTTERSHRQDTGLLVGVYASTVSIGRAVSPAIGGISYDYHQAMPTVIALILYVVSAVLTLKYTSPNQKLYTKKKVQ